MGICVFHRIHIVFSGEIRKMSYAYCEHCSSIWSMSWCWLRKHADVVQWLEFQSSKLIMRVRFPSSALVVWHINIRKYAKGCISTIRPPETAHHTNRQWNRSSCGGWCHGESWNSTEAIAECAVCKTAGVLIRRTMIIAQKDIQSESVKQGRYPFMNWWWLCIIVIHETVISVTAKAETKWSMLWLKRSWYFWGSTLLSKHFMGKW